MDQPLAGTARFIVGRDTRLSSSLLQAALSAGLAGEGIDVVDAGHPRHAGGRLPFRGAEAHRRR